MRLPSLTLGVGAAGWKALLRTTCFVVGCVAAGTMLGSLLTSSTTSRPEIEGTAARAPATSAPSAVTPAAATAAGVAPSDLSAAASGNASVAAPAPTEFAASAGLVPIEPSQFSPSAGEVKLAAPLPSVPEALALPIGHPGTDTGAGAAAAASAPPRAVAAMPAPPGPAAPAVRRTPLRPAAAVDADTLIARGDALLAGSDVVAARLFYRLAADAGSSAAALAMAGTFDPDRLRVLGVRGVAGDAKQAIVWYRRALSLGEDSARPPLDRLLSVQDAAIGPAPFR